MQQIWGQHVKKEKAETIPIIIPILFYHGEQKWEETKTISDWVGGYHKFPLSIQKYVPDYDFMYYNFSLHGDEEVKGNPKLQAYLELSKHIFIKDMETFLEVMMIVDELLNENDPSYFDTVMIYILSIRDDLPVDTVKERLTIEGRKRFMSIAEKIRKEEKIMIAKKLLLLKLDEKQIMEATDLTKEELKQIKKELDS
ncbi:Rpn family recombination-promoting nuclease/putative transposase [Oceanobacillus locisalsi]|uniref:Rpn family recombination-promoting nuclease/putative transposase n=1 Tax=Oceanobacillus locisalsi TaxID=546107 RepID=A0ABW3NDI5_9BACI